MCLASQVAYFGDSLRSDVVCLDRANWDPVAIVEELFVETPENIPLQVCVWGWGCAIVRMCVLVCVWSKMWSCVVDVTFWRAGHNSLPWQQDGTDGLWLLLVFVSVSFLLEEEAWIPKIAQSKIWRWCNDVWADSMYTIRIEHHFLCCRFESENWCTYIDILLPQQLSQCKDTCFCIRCNHRLTKHSLLKILVQISFVQHNWGHTWQRWSSYVQQRRGGGVADLPKSGHKMKFVCTSTLLQASNKRPSPAD